MKKSRFLDAITSILLIISGLNWGLIGIFDWNLLESIFAEMIPFLRVIYVFIGAAALYRILILTKVKIK